MPTQILSQFKRLVAQSSPTSSLLPILDEAIAVIPSVEAFTPTVNAKGQAQGGGGNALAVYRPPAEVVYRVNYTVDDIGNLLHELTHICVDRAYDRDFIGYARVGGHAPARVLDLVGNCTNTDARRTVFKDDGTEVAIKGKLDEMKTLARLCTFKTSEKLTAIMIGSEVPFVHTKAETAAWRKDIIMGKLNYAYGGPSIDYDTVLNQLLVYMHQFGYRLYIPFRVFGRIIRNSPSPEQKLLALIDFYAKQAYDKRRLARA
jgi:hypothetical protein